MALIRTFDKVSRNRYTVHGEVGCEVSAFVANGKTYLQFDTGGSRTRKLKGKTSQSIQADEDSAAAMLALLRATFKVR